MFKRILFIFLVILNTLAIAENDSAIINAEKAFNSDNLSKLTQTYSANRTNSIVSYFYAKSMLNHNSIIYATSFIQREPDEYMRTDLIHQLLAFYMNKKNYSSYLSYYALLNPKQTSVNEKCGYDVSNIYLNKNLPIQSDLDWLTNNNLPTWCAQLVMLSFNRHQVDLEQKDYMLYNLLANGKTDIFNAVANSPINFGHYMSYSARSLPKNKYLEVYYVTTIAKKDPENGLSAMNKFNLDKNTQDFLNNYLAMQFAIKHNFKSALNSWSNSHTANFSDDDLSDDEFEWEARTYLYYGSWPKLIGLINLMPTSLKTKNVWQYWLAKAYDGTNQDAKADEILNKIPADYSYYSMLAQGELGTLTAFQASPPANLGNLPLSNISQRALHLHNLGDSYSSKTLYSLSAFEWYYIAKKSESNTLLSMSKGAYNVGTYDFAIYAANQLPTRYYTLSFPIPFADLFKKFAKMFNIDLSYALAISRQESRFNAKVIAFDGGVGLMQIMPQTGSYIAYKSHSSNCYKSGAMCNIKFGAWYLGSLYSKFRNLIYSTAAYNGGPGRARRWQDKLGILDNRIQIELIPITITREYVQKVLTNKAIYDAELKNQYKVNLLDYITNIKQNHYIDIPDDDDTDAQKLQN